MKKIILKIITCTFMLSGLASLSYADITEEDVRQYSEENRFGESRDQTLHALYQLKYKHENSYAVGMTVALVVDDIFSDDEDVTIKRVLGGGGSKKAVELEDGRVLMFPNTDIDMFGNIAYWWPTCVRKEVAMRKYLDGLRIPALNRKVGYIQIPHKDDPTILYTLPVMVSFSFDQYKEMGWYVIDNKNSHSTNHPEGEDWLEMVNNDIGDFEGLFDELIHDLYLMLFNDISIGTDSSNYVFKKDRSTGEYQMRYFGFDFGGKYGNKDVPSSEKYPNYAHITTEEIPSELKELLLYAIGDFVLTIVPKEDYDAFYSKRGEISRHHSNEYIRKVLTKRYPSSRMCHYHRSKISLDNWLSEEEEIFKVIVHAVDERENKYDSTYGAGMVDFEALRDCGIDFKKLNDNHKYLNELLKKLLTNNYSNKSYKIDILKWLLNEGGINFDSIHRSSSSVIELLKTIAEIMQDNSAKENFEKVEGSILNEKMIKKINGDVRSIAKVVEGLPKNFFGRKDITGWDWLTDHGLDLNSLDDREQKIIDKLLYNEYSYNEAAEIVNQEILKKLHQEL